MKYFFSFVLGAIMMMSSTLSCAEDRFAIALADPQVKVANFIERWKYSGGKNALVPALNYTNVRPADKWPDVTHIISTPPYLGNGRMRQALGEDYVDALYKAYPNLSHDIDYAMYWVARAGMLVRDGEVKAFGFILTDKVKQQKNRKVIDAFLSGTPRLNIDMAAPSHP